MLVIFCPSCSAGLQLPRSVLATRSRRICCAICEHRWVEAPVIEQAGQENVQAAEQGPELSLHAENSRSDETARADPEQSLEKPEDHANAPRLPQLPRVVRPRPRRPKPIPRAWPRFAAVIGAMALALVALAKREDIVRLAPPLAGAYAALGLPVNVQGLEWRAVRTSLVTEASQKVLAVEGEIRNLRTQSQSLPDIQLSLRDNSGREVYVWKTPAPKADLGGGETIAFRARLASPPGSASAVRVVFAEAKTDKMTP
jgi:hypothetical protein